LLGIQDDPAASDAKKLSSLDLARSYSAQNLADAKLPNSLSTAIDKLQKGKSLDRAFGSGAALGSAVSKGALNKEDPSADSLPTSLKGANEASKALESDANSSSDLKLAKEAAQGADLAAGNALAGGLGGLAKIDAQGAGSQHVVAMKSSDLSLANGPLHSEIMNAAKSGGGRITLELTPPEQGTIRIDLRIAQNGQAHLIVEGASDATKSRLDQGGQNLKNEFAQMGLSLSLDLRQGAQFQMAQGQGFANSRQSLYASAASPSSSIKRQSGSALIFAVN